MSPTVDTSTEKFTWAVPNFVAVRDYTSDKFGWTKAKTDQVVKPIIRKMTAMGQSIEFQSRIDNYFQSERTVLPKKGRKLESSKRVKEAIQRVLHKERNPPHIQKSSTERNGDKSEKSKRKKKGTSSKMTKPRGPSKKSKESNIQSNIAEKSLVAQSDSANINGTKDWETQEKEKKENTKRKAIDIYKKSRNLKSNQRKISTPKPTSKVSKSRNSGGQRKVLAKHNLSESEEDHD